MDGRYELATRPSRAPGAPGRADGVPDGVPDGVLSGVTVAVVEDRTLVADILQRTLRLEGAHAFRVDPVGGRDPRTVPATADLLVPAMVGALAGADVVLLDLDLGSPPWDGLPMLAPLVATGARLVALTGPADHGRLGACLVAGAAGVLTKFEAVEGLVDQVARVAAGLPTLSVQRRRELLAAHRAEQDRRRRVLAPFDALTRREGEVLAGLLRGHRVDELAERLYVGEATVRSHVRAVLRKLEVSSQLAAVARARAVGWDAATAYDRRSDAVGA